MRLVYEKRVIWMLGLLASVNVGCFEECTSNADCRERFGDTYSCNPEINQCAEFEPSEPRTGGVTTSVPPTPTSPSDAGVVDTAVTDAAAEDATISADGGSSSALDASIPDNGIAPSSDFAGLIRVRAVQVEDGTALRPEIELRDITLSTGPTTLTVSTAPDCVLTDRRGLSPTGLWTDELRLTVDGGSVLTFSHVSGGRYSPSEVVLEMPLTGRVGVELSSVSANDVRSRQPVEGPWPLGFTPHSPRPQALTPLRAPFLWRPIGGGPEEVAFELAGVDRLVLVRCTVPYTDATFIFPEAALSAILATQPAGARLGVTASAESTWSLPLDVGGKTFDAELRVSHGTSYEGY